MKLFLVFVLVAVAIVSAGNMYRPRDCQDLWDVGVTTSSTYTIFPEEQSRGIRVRCDMASDDPGWTYIQFRNTSTDFELIWRDYENGFGDPSADHWLENQYISKITSQDGYQLRMDITVGADDDRYALYDQFRVFDASTKYQLLVSGYIATSTAGDQLYYHNGYPFSTSDADNDGWSDNCAAVFSGGWWWSTCHLVNMNGKWGVASSEGVYWAGYTESITRTEMKIRRFKPLI